MVMSNVSDVNVKYILPFTALDVVEVVAAIGQEDRAEGGACRVIKNLICIFDVLSKYFQQDLRHTDQKERIQLLAS